MTTETPIKPKEKNSAIRDYARCVWANKATLAGYLGLGASIDLLVFGNNHDSINFVLSSIILGQISGGLLGATAFGLQTFDTYRETRNYISKFGKIKEEYQNLKHKVYCTRVGIRLAAREAGLESSLEQGGQE